MESKKTKLLVICGPTSVGKTSLGIYLSKKFNGEIISADSRQFFKDFDIGTGKILGNLEKAGADNSLHYVSKDGVPVWGFDIVEADGAINASVFEVYARHKISEVQDRGNLPILVGGSGFYIKTLISNSMSSDVPPNPELREQLSKKSVTELYNALLKIDNDRAIHLNKSDRLNKVRLVRAIEIGLGRENVEKNAESSNFKSYDLLKIGLRARKETLLRNINDSVNLRLKMGFEDELQSLLKKGISWENQAMNSLGYRQWKSYLDGKISRESAIELWKREEYRYTKRQMTWFKTDGEINWFDIESLDYRNEVEQFVKKWHNNN